MSLNTAFSPNPDTLAQLTGTGVAFGPVSLTYASTQPIGPLLVAGNRYVRVLGVNATSATTSITTTFVAPAGSLLIVQVDAVGGTVTATFSTGFKPSATAAPTIGTTMTVNFVSNGTYWMESARSVAVTS